jgi:hypothetical protein
MHLVIDVDPITVQLGHACRSLVCFVVMRRPS